MSISWILVYLLKDAPYFEDFCVILQSQTPIKNDFNCAQDRIKAKQ